MLNFQPMLRKQKFRNFKNKLYPMEIFSTIFRQLQRIRYQFWLIKIDMGKRINSFFLTLCLFLSILFLPSHVWGQSCASPPGPGLNSCETFTFDATSSPAIMPGGIMSGMVGNGNSCNGDIDGAFFEETTPTGTTCTDLGLSGSNQMFSVNISTNATSISMIVCRDNGGNPNLCNPSIMPSSVAPPCNNTANQCGVSGPGTPAATIHVSGSCTANLSLTELINIFQLVPTSPCDATNTLITFDDDNDLTNTLPSWGLSNTSGSLDLLSIPELDIFDPAITCPASTVIWVSYSKTGGCFTAPKPITVTLKDITAPVITCPDDVDVECGGPTDVATTGMATATDCSEVEITSQDVFTPSCGMTGVIERTWTATDDCGNSSSCVQTITIEDTTKPEITCPADVTVECDENMDPIIIANGFVDDFAPSNWATQTNNGNGSLLATSSSFQLTGATNGSFSNPNFDANLEVCISAPMDGSISFDWSYSSTDFAFFDGFLYTVDENSTVLAVANGQSGSAMVNLSAGQEFCFVLATFDACLLYTSPSPRDATLSRMPSSA